jgi:hypothetical protein
MDNGSRYKNTQESAPALLPDQDALKLFSAGHASRKTGS